MIQCWICGCFPHNKDVNDITVADSSLIDSLGLWENRDIGHNQSLSDHYHSSVRNPLVQSATIGKKDSSELQWQGSTRKTPSDSWYAHGLEIFIGDLARSFFVSARKDHALALGRPQTMRRIRFNRLTHQTRYLWQSSACFKFASEGTHALAG